MLCSGYRILVELVSVSCEAHLLPDQYGALLASPLNPPLPPPPL